MSKLTEKLNEMKGAVVAIIFFVTLSFTGYGLFAKEADFKAFKAMYEEDKEAARRKELREIIFECKTRYGADYKKAPDEFTVKYCRDAEIELEESKEG